jgi:protein-disulfide isomerase
MSTTTPRPTRDERRRAARAQRQAVERAAAQRAQRTLRLWQLAAALAAAAIIVAAAVIAGGSGGATPDRNAPIAQAASVHRLLHGIPQRGDELGAREAPVTLVEFADLKCRVCRDYSLNVLPTLVQRYVRTGKLKIQFRAQHFVGEQLNPGDSLAAARFALAAARQNRLWNFSELFYANQRDERTRYVGDAYLRRLGAAIPGLAADRALADRTRADVSAQLQQAGEQFTARGFTGTPSFLLGRTGATLAPLEYHQLAAATFTSAIDRLLAR